MNISRRHRHGKAWEQIGVDDSGEPMLRVRWTDWAGILFFTALGLAVWAYCIAWMVS